MYPQNIKQLITVNTIKLLYTSWDLNKFVEGLSEVQAPIKWNTDERFKLACELDAIYFKLYNISRVEIDYIMESFPIVKRRDLERHGNYRTKETILKYYDEIEIS